jgi:hypothetical protein
MLGTPKGIAPNTKTGKALVAAGYTVVKEVKTRPHKLARSRAGRWYEVITPGGMSAVFMRQSDSAYHVFGSASWTASASSIERAHEGGLGDAIGTDAELKTYGRLVMSAPERLSREYDGLYAAQSQVFNG